MWRIYYIILIINIAWNSMKAICKKGQNTGLARQSIEYCMYDIYCIFTQHIIKYIEAWTAQQSILYTYYYTYYIHVYQNLIMPHADHNSNVYMSVCRGGEQCDKQLSMHGALGNIFDCKQWTLGDYKTEQEEDRTEVSLNSSNGKRSLSRKWQNIIFIHTGAELCLNSVIPLWPASYQS